ncbi:hypothetical protein [Streptomyces sp. CL12]|uniref:hypothetical protein n=1 Tax=Streptomyces sp. CL12 TaxID=3391744 RepID=UPI003A8129CC
MTNSTAEAPTTVEAPAQETPTSDDAPQAGGKDVRRDHGATPCTSCAPVLEQEMGRAVSIYAAAKLMASYGDEWECLWHSLEDRRDAVIVLSLMAEQLCQEVARHTKTSEEAVLGRLISDQFRDLPSFEPKTEKSAPSIVRQAEKIAEATGK